MKHLGDITKINGADVPPVDVVVGGSPCQDLSVAGKRAGLAGERSGLYMDKIRIVKEMRKADVLRGRTDELIRPRFMVWENVTGAFSSNGGADFAAVLEEAVRVIEPEAPPVSVPDKGWPKAGCLYDVDGRWSIAWRVHDAQFWGVTYFGDEGVPVKLGTPQRRRRISLVADYAGLAAPEVLFERKGLHWNPEPCPSAGEEIAANSYRCTDADHSSGVIGIDCYNKTLTGCVSKSMTSAASDSDHVPCVIISEPTAFDDYNFNATGRITSSLRSGASGGACGVTIISPSVQDSCILDDQGGSQICVRTDGKSPPLRAQGHGHPPLVPCKTYPVESHPQDSRMKIAKDDVCQALTGKMGTGGVMFRWC